MKKTDSYNKYVPLFIDNYAEQRSAKLRARMGWAGYGIYLAILQRLRSEKDCVLELDYETLAFSFWTDEDTLRSIIEDFGLFTIDREKTQFSSPMLDEMLRTIDPALSKSRNKRYSLQVPANEELASCIATDAPNSDGETLVKCVQVPANEELASCVATDALEDGCEVPENSVQVLANEELASCVAADAPNSDGEALENGLQVPANEELASDSHACVRVNKQTNKQTNEQEKEERRKTSSLLVTEKEESRGAEEQRVTNNEGNICEELNLFAKSCDARGEGKAKKAKSSATLPLRRKRASVRGHLLRTPVYLNPPTVEEVAAYARHLGYADFQADRFVAYYAANGWKTTRHDMMNWHAAVSTWHLNQCRYAEERAQQAKQKAEQQERRELHYQQDREWRNRVFLERNASQEQQDRLFHQERQQFLQQQVVQAITSQEDKYALPPCVPF